MILAPRMNAPKNADGSFQRMVRDEKGMFVDFQYLMKANRRVTELESELDELKKQNHRLKTANERLAKIMETRDLLETAVMQKSTEIIHQTLGLPRKEPA